MNCGRCNRELDIDEKWNGDTELSCSACGTVNGSSHKAPCEEAIPGLRHLAPFLGGSEVTELERLTDTA